MLVSVHQGAGAAGPDQLRGQLRRVGVRAVANTGAVPALRRGDGGLRLLSLLGDVLAEEVNAIDLVLVRQLASAELLVDLGLPLQSRVAG